MQSYAAQTNLHRLISVFVIHFLESIISKLATGKIYIFQLVSVTGEIDFSLALSETPKTDFVKLRPIYSLVYEVYPESLIIIFMPPASKIKGIIVFGWSLCFSSPLF